MSPEREAQLKALEARLGHGFANLALLDQALTHTSRAHEDGYPGLPHNEPLEFLGDAVLGFVVAVMLHRSHPEGAEGRKSQLRAHLVSAPSLARRAEVLGLPSLLRLGRGEEKTGGRGKRALWGDAYEAVIAALYLDGGLPAAQAFLEREMSAEVASADQATLRDHKTLLQEWLQAQSRPLPQYVVIEELGPSHRRRFRVQCRIEDRAAAEGEGFSKKEAQQAAAERALRLLEGEKPRS